jgi:hypothetical protein
MNTNISERYDHDGLVISVTPDDRGQLVVQWFGVSDSRDPSTDLVPFLAHLSESCRAKAVLIDFSKFEYMNSATVSPLINFIKQLDALGAWTTLRFDASVPWQKTNAQCMRAIARTLNHLTVQ